jgi:hypothetical protein
MKDTGVQMFSKCLSSNFSYFIGLHSSLLYAKYIVVTNTNRKCFSFHLLNTPYVLESVFQEM